MKAEKLDGMVLEIGTSMLPVYSSPGSLETMGLYGERVFVEKARSDGWLEGRLLSEGAPEYDYPGLFKRKGLVPQGASATHLVSVREAVLYNTPSFKDPKGTVLYLNSQVRLLDRVEARGGAMCRTAAGWLFEDQLRSVNDPYPDFVEVIVSQLLTSPYSWGGRGQHYDCASALQAGMIAAGEACPRDCIPQSKAVGEEFDFARDFSNLRRGDLVFWTEEKGRHVAVMVDATFCVHVSIAEGVRGCVQQPLSVVIKTQEEDENGRPTMVRRLPNYKFA